MAQLTFEEVWKALHKLEGKTITTLGKPRRNRIVAFDESEMRRQTEADDGKGWKDEQPIRKRAFETLWHRLRADTVVQLKDITGYKYLVAACLVSVRELGVEKVKDRPLTIELKSASEATPPLRIDDEIEEEFGDLGRIVVDPDICSGKPTIRGTRIMVANILGMFSGGYSINRVLKAYPQLSRLDVISALEYASWVVDREKIIARG